MVSLDTVHNAATADLYRGWWCILSSNADALTHNNKRKSTKNKKENARVLKDSSALHSTLWHARIRFQSNAHMTRHNTRLITSSRRTVRSIWPWGARSRISTNKTLWNSQTLTKKLEIKAMSPLDTIRIRLRGSIWVRVCHTWANTHHGRILAHPAWVKKYL